jgi:hypothetical protein
MGQLGVEQNQIQELRLAILNLSEEGLSQCVDMVEGKGNETWPKIEEQIGVQMANVRAAPSISHSDV